MSYQHQPKPKPKPSRRQSAAEICPVETTLGIMGGKWKPVILWRLEQHDSLRFSVLKRLIPGITQRMLTQQLRELEADGVISRQIEQARPPKVVSYRLTELGISLRPVLHVMSDWGKRHEQKLSVSSQPDSAASAE